jgi:hypothetical protein
VTLLNQCKRLLLSRGATLDGSAPQPLRGHLRDGTNILVLCKDVGAALAEGERTAIDEIRRGGGLAFCVRSLAELRLELETAEA